MTDQELSPTEESIFISYRMETDKELALALKKLLEKVLEPAPSVFVASAGGIKPSQIGWREQLNQSVRKAKIFIGLITKNSKDREWILFEAGAAWGREQLYAPLLVDLLPGDLPSSISAYQSTSAFDKESVRKLIGVVAEEIKLTVKNTFSKSFNSFSRSAERYKERSPQVEEATALSDEKYPQVVDLIKQGKRDEAAAMIDKLSSSLSSLEDLAELKLLPIIHSNADSSELLSALDKLDSKLKQTKPYLFWAAWLERDISPHRSLDYWNQYLSFPLSETEYWFPACERIRLLCQLGRKEEALTHLRVALQTNNRPLISQAAQLYVELFSDHPPHSKLLILTIALSSGDHTLYQLGFDLSLDAGWNELALLFAEMYHREEDTAQSSHKLAQVLHELKLPSLAFQSYQRGIEEGSLISAASAANLLAHQPVAAAGQALLKNFDDAPNDALKPDYPHSVRATLESKIAEERKKFAVHKERATVVLNQIIELAELAVKVATSFKMDANLVYRNKKGDAFHLEFIEDANIVFSLVLHSERGKLRYKFKAIPPFPGIYQDEYGIIFFVAIKPNVLRGIKLDSSLTNPPIEIIEFVGRDKNDTDEVRETDYA